MNAPEKLYISKNIYSTFVYQVPNPDDETEVEYIRADAFIDKNTPETKEVDLEKEYKEFINCDNGRSMFETAKHFFELGLKMRNNND